MPETDETLAAIIAEMREAGRSDEHADGPLIEDYADRIEAAAKRERDEDRQLAAIAESDEAFARCARCDRPARAPGNAAAMRDLLEKIRHEYGWGRISCRTCVSSEADVERVSDLFEKQIDDALAAPARNCDRFQTANEAVAAFADHLRGWENAHGIHSEYPDHPVQVPAGAFAWLFGKAEGKDADTANGKETDNE